MQKTARLFLLFVFTLLVSACDNAGPPVVSVEDEDEEMAAAIAAARESLPHFWHVFDTREGGESDFSLKVAITDSRGTEHFWVMDLERRDDGTIMGTLNNEPRTVRSVELGERIEVPEADISDWMYMRRGKMVGNRTLRPLFKHMPPEEVERLKQMLAEP